MIGNPKYDRKTVIQELEKLDDYEFAKVRNALRICPDCGKVIFINSGRRKRCLMCAALEARRQSSQWAKDNLSAVGYEHDDYISKRKFPTKLRQ